VTTGSDNPFPKIIVVEGTAPASPAAGRQALFVDSADHHWKRKNSGGTVTDLETGGGAALTVEEVDGTPTDSAVTRIVFPNGTLSIASHVATYTPAGGGGGASVPRVVQIKTAGTAATSITLDSAPASGHSVILATNATNTGLVTSVSSTNTTWTRVASRSSASVFYEIWVGVVAGGAGGTAITITHSNSFLSCTALEVVDTLTGTAGLTANGTTSASIAATTSGHLIVAMTSNANTTIVAAVDMTILRLGLASAIVPLVVGYSVGDAISVVGTATSGTVVAEVT
jgi:hypothetical protein